MTDGRTARVNTIPPLAFRYYCIMLMMISSVFFLFCRWTLIGIVSAGYSCAKRGQPGIYHRVARTADWISHSVNSP